MTEKIVKDLNMLIKETNRVSKNKIFLREFETNLCNAILNDGYRITIAELYNALGVEVPDVVEFQVTNEKEFIDPYEWGWDRHGFRQLYRKKVVLEPIPTELNLSEMIDL